MKKGIIIAILFCSIITCSKVKADTLTNTIWQTYYYDVNKTTPYPTSTSGNWQYESLPSTTNNNWGGYYLYLGTDIIKTNFDYVLIPFNITGYTSISDTTNDLSGVGCIISGSIASDGTYRYNSFICPSNTTYSSQTQTSEVKVSVSLHEKNGDNDSPCVYENGYMKCSVLPNVTYGKMYITYNIPYDLQYSTKINFGKAIQFYKDIFNTIAENQNTQINQTQEIIESNTTYENNATESFTNETQEINDYEQAEANLLNNLDFSAVNEKISINPNASQFIWNIVEGLRNMNGAIILLMSSVFSIGLIKLILNR